jgi:hypothetical protein
LWSSRMIREGTRLVTLALDFEPLSFFYQCRKPVLVQQPGRV